MIAQDRNSLAVVVMECMIALPRAWVFVGAAVTHSIKRYSEYVDCC